MRIDTLLYLADQPVEREDIGKITLQAGYQCDVPSEVKEVAVYYPAGISAYEISDYCLWIPINDLTELSDEAQEAFSMQQPSTKNIFYIVVKAHLEDLIPHLKIILSHLGGRIAYEDASHIFTLQEIDNIANSC